ncbi:MAG: pimeloyl-CoA dehydrogenase large subunit [Rhodospirillales bacterium]|nr:pimeloyl-CoA dehydrogenase large subunit [Rhodospirillales bacterium]
MELSFTPDELAFREEVRRFFRGEIPQALRRKVLEGQHLTKDEIVTSQRILNARGWAVPNWPVEWGGQDWSPVQVYMYQDEMQQAGVPAPLGFNTSMVGPVIAQFGNRAQKERYLAATANLDIWWCQGFSEPGAGSDLASLRTSAKRVGDSWVINGQKTWTTLAQHADWIFVLCRTDPAAKKQEGISFILADMKTPGITVRPIQTIDGGHEVNEVFFDDVVVPYENLVGEENKGWDCAKFLLGNERTGIARVGTSKARLKRIRELAALERIGDRPLIESAKFREKLAAVEIELKALEMTQLRIVADERGRAKGKPNPASSILKLKGSVIQQATTELMMEVVGPYAMPYVVSDEGDGRNEPGFGSDYAAGAAPTYFNWRKISIYGGSNEIQRNIVAKAILGF